MTSPTNSEDDDYVLKAGEVEVACQ